MHPSSGVLKTVFATSGVRHGNGTVTSFLLGLIRTGVSESFMSHETLKVVYYAFISFCYEVWINILGELLIYSKNFKV